MANIDNNLNLHFRILGSFLENVEMYRKPKIAAVKDIVLKAVSSSDDKSASTREIKKILCINGIQIISSPVLNSALQELQREEKLEYSVETKKYTSNVESDLNGSGIIEIIENVYERFFSSCDNCTLDDFSNALSSLFARYGCGAYESLQSNSGDDFVRVSNVIEGLFAARGKEFMEEFTLCFEQFIFSKDPDAAKLKFQLISTYAILRMNGAGNWGVDALEKFINNKTFAIDTNVLFDVFCANKKQLLRVFEEIKKNGASFVVGAETLKELEDVVRYKSVELVRLVDKSVDVRSLLKRHILNNDFVEAIYNVNETPNAEFIKSYTEKIICEVDEWLNEIGAERIHLEITGDSEERRSKVKILKDKSLALKKRKKGSSSATHDALLWELIEDKGRQGDIVISQDRTLSKVSVGANKRLSIMLDELLAYVLLGNVSEVEMAEIFNYTLSRDLISDSDFLTIKDIESIASMEASILNAPEPLLRQAIKEINAKKSEALSSGETFEPADVQRIVIQIISTYKEDRRELEIERSRKLSSDEDHQKQISDLERKISGFSERLEESERKQSKTSFDYDVLKDHSGRVDERSTNQKGWVLIFVLYLTASVLIYFLLPKASVIALTLFITTVVSMFVISVSPKVPDPSMKFIFLPTLPSVVISVIINWKKIEDILKSVSASP